VQGWVIAIIAIGYVTFLFVIASLGDRRAAAGKMSGTRPLIYALSLAIYCTSWTFFGSVGLATERAFEFLAIYIGPVLVLSLQTGCSGASYGLRKGKRSLRSLIFWRPVTARASPLPPWRRSSPLAAPFPTLPCN